MGIGTFVSGLIIIWAFGTLALAVYLIHNERKFNRLMDAQDEAIALTRQPPEDTEQWEGWAWEDGHL